MNLQHALAIIERIVHIHDFCDLFISIMSLFVACESGDVVEVQRLLNGLDKLSLSERDDHGCTPLHIACARGNIEVVKLLLDLGANFEWKDYNGTTCLHYACAYGQVDVVKMW